MLATVDKTESVSDTAKSTTTKKVKARTSLPPLQQPPEDFPTEKELSLEASKLTEYLSGSAISQLSPTQLDATVELFVQRIQQIEVECQGIEKQVASIMQKRSEKERSATIDYWYLGKLLEAKRAVFRGGEKGAWGEWLESKGIERTKSQRARAIAEGYKAPDDLRELTLNDALKNLKRQPDEMIEIGPRGQIEQRCTSFKQWISGTAVQKLFQKVSEKGRVVDTLNGLINELQTAKDRFEKVVADGSPLASQSAETINV